MLIRRNMRGKQSLKAQRVSEGHVNAKISASEPQVPVKLKGK